MKRILSIVAVLGLVFAAGCGGSDGGSELAAAEQAISSVDSANIEGAIVATAVEGLNATMQPEDMAAAAAAGAAGVYTPSDCVTAQTNANTVTYTLTDCTGPYGLVEVDGSFDATFSVRLNKVTVEVQGSVTANQTSTDLDLEATYTVAGSTNTLQVTTTTQALGSRGNLLNHSGSYTVTWDTQASCLAIDGEWSVTIGSLTWTLSVSDFEACAGSCPQGSIEYNGGIHDVTITITFDGSNQAQWSSSKGREGTLPLFCS